MPVNGIQSALVHEAALASDVPNAEVWLDYRAVNGNWTPESSQLRRGSHTAMGRRVAVWSRRVPWAAVVAMLAVAAAGLALDFQTGTVVMCVFLAVAFALAQPLMKGLSKWPGRGEPPDWWGARVESTRWELILIAGIATVAAVGLLVWAAVAAVL